MSAKQVHYHEGAATDVKSAVAWYQKRSRKAALAKSAVERLASVTRDRCVFARTATSSSMTATRPFGLVSELLIS